MPAAVLLIDINARLAKLEESVNKIPGIFGASGKRVEAQLSGITKQLLAFGRTAVTVFGIPLGGAALVGFLKDVGERVAEEERGFAKLNATLRATQNASGLTAARLGSIADSLKSSTVFDDDEIRQAEIALLRFRTVQQGVFEEAIRLAPDVAAALGTDLVSAATALGRALTDPEGGMKALKAAGVNLSEQQKDLAARFIEAGDKASAQRIVLDELRKSVGGTAGAENTGIYGASKNLSKAWDDLLKSLGRQVAGSATSGINLLAEGISKFASVTEKAANHYERLLLLTGGAASLATGGAIGIPVGRLFGPGDSSARTATGKIGGLPDRPNPAELAAEAGARDERLRQREEQVYLDQQAALKRRADGAAQAYASMLSQTKFFVDRDVALYEDAYSRGTVATSDFYDRLRASAEQSTQAVLKGLTQQGEAVIALINAPSTSREERQSLFTRLQGIASQSDEARLTLKKRILDLDIQEGQAVERLGDRYAGLSVQLAELRGDTAGAATKGFALQNRELFDRLNSEAGGSNPNFADRAARAREELVAIGELVAIRAQLSEKTQDYQLTLDDLAITLDRIGIAEQSGASTELEALRARSDANAAYVATLKQQLVVLEAIAQASGRREDLVKVEQLRAQMEAVAAAGDLVAKKFNDIGASSFSQLLQDLAHGVKPLDALKGFGQNVFDRVFQTVSDNLAQKAFGKDGIFSGFGEVLGGLFGGQQGGALALTSSATALTGSATALTAAAGALSASAAVSSTTGSLGSLGNIFQGFGGDIGGDILTSLQGFDVGSDYVPRNMVAKIHKGERIVPAAQNQRDTEANSRGGSWRAGGNITVNAPITIAGNADSRTVRQIAREINGAVSAARSRG